MSDDPSLTDQLTEAGRQGKLFEAVCVTEGYQTTIIRQSRSVPLSQDKATS